MSALSRPAAPRGPEAPGRLLGAYRKMLAGIGALVAGGYPASQAAARAAIMGALALGVIIQLAALAAKFIPGVHDLADIDRSFSSPRVMVFIGYFVGLSMSLVAVLLLASLPDPSSFSYIEYEEQRRYLVGVAVIADLVLRIGYAGLMALVYKLYEKEREALYLASFALFIAAIFVPSQLSIIQLIAWVLLYAALGHSVGELARAA